MRPLLILAQTRHTRTCGSRVSPGLHIQTRTRTRRTLGSDPWQVWKPVLFTTSKGSGDFARATCVIEIWVLGVTLLLGGPVWHWAARKFTSEAPQRDQCSIGLYVRSQAS